MNYYPFLISSISGLSTLIGFFFIYIKKDKEKIIKNSLALSSGIMLCVSIIELMPEGINLLKSTYIKALLPLIIGMSLPILINKTIKEEELYKIGIISSIAIMMHNIPEGIITYLTSVKI